MSNINKLKQTVQLLRVIYTRIHIKGEVNPARLGQQFFLVRHGWAKPRENVLQNFYYHLNIFTYYIQAIT